jgi:DNA-binding NarL/FixJ family response regulator
VAADPNIRFVNTNTSTHEKVREDLRADAYRDLVSPEAQSTVSEAAIQVIHPASISVSIVSDSKLLVEGLTRVLELSEDSQLTGSYSTISYDYMLQAERHFESFSLVNPLGHVVLVDNNIGRDRTLAWISYWGDLTPSAFVVVLNVTSELDTILAYYKAGASGFLLPSESTADLMVMIKRLELNVVICPPEITSQLFARLISTCAEYGFHGLLGEHSSSHFAALSSLTARQAQVLDYMTKDYRNQEIAKVLVIEVHTVKRHVQNILEKLGCRSRFEAARLAREQGWVTR